MNPQWAFYALAGGLSALVLWALWRSVRRSALQQPGGGAGVPIQSLRWSFGIGLGVLLLAFGLYGVRGNPDALSDNRVALSEQLLEQGLPPPGKAADALYQALERHLKKQPDDPRALVLKARLDMQAERYAPAVAAFKGALVGRSKVVNDAGVWVEYAEALAMVQGGSLRGEPQRLLLKALEMDGRHAKALDLAGSAAWEAQDYNTALHHWRRLQQQLASDDSRQTALQAAIASAQRRARFSLPSPSDARQP